MSTSTRQGLDASYANADAVYRRIFTRCGLDLLLAVDADSGSMGGSASQEFMVYTDAGEDPGASSASGCAANAWRRRRQSWRWLKATWLRRVTECRRKFISGSEDD